MKKLLFQRVLILFGMALITFSCSTDDDQKTEVPIEQSNNFNALKSDVAPLEVVLLYSKNVLNKDSYSGNINGTSIEMSKFNDTTLVFVMPKNIANINGKLSFLVEEKLEEIDFNVSSLNLVTDPDTEIQLLIQKLMIDMGEGEENSTLLEYNEIFQENISSFNVLYSALSDEDKILTATFLKVNLGLENSDTYAIKSLEDNCFNQRSLEYLANKKRAIAGLILMTGAVMAPEPAISKVAAVIGAGFFVGYVYATTNSVESLVSCITLKDFFSLETIQKSSGDIYSFDNKTDYVVNFLGKYEGLSKQDLNSENSILKSISTSIEEFKILLLDYKKHYNTFVNFLGLSSSLSLNVPEMLPNSPVASEIKSIEETNISPVTISSEKIEIKSNGMVGSDYIMAFSNNTIEEQIFDIQITGTEEGFAATGDFKIALEPSKGIIDILDGNDKTINDINEASVFLTVRNEDNKPVENAIIELISGNSLVSFLPANNFTTGANGVVSFKVKISPENTSSSVFVGIKLKNQAGEVLAEEALTVHINLESRLINGSPWKVTSYKVHGREHFSYMNLGNDTCYPDGVFDKQKMLEATYQFFPGSANMSATMELIRYDCATSSYITSQFQDGSGHSWKIDENTGKFVVIMNGVEVAWLTVQVSESGIYMTGPYKIEGEEETTLSMRLEKP